VIIWILTLRVAIFSLVEPVMMHSPTPCGTPHFTVVKATIQRAPFGKIHISTAGQEMTLAQLSQGIRSVSETEAQLRLYPVRLLRQLLLLVLRLLL